MFYEDKTTKLFNKDCRDMSELPDESVDLLVTDPPYGIGFMGKDWDKFNEIVDPQGAYAKKKGFKKLPRNSSAFIVEFFTPIWKECLRVLKPGAFAFVMCIPRADCLSRVIISLEDAGFRVDFTPIYWAYASGFPKAQNIGKSVMKRVGDKGEVVGRGSAGYQVSISKTRKEQGYRPNETRATKEFDLVKPTDPRAQALDGSYGGFQPKPAVEVIIVAMKPLSRITRSDFAGEYDYFYTSRIVITDKNETGRKLKVKLEQKYNIALKAGDVIESRIGINPQYNDEVILKGEKLLESKPYTNSDLSGYISEALKNRKGITWLDSVRIPYQKQDKPLAGNRTATFGTQETVSGGDGSGGFEASPSGRFPANLLVSDDMLNDGRVRKSGDLLPGHKRGTGINFGGGGVIRNAYGGDSGSFSRFFDLDKWAQKTFPFLICAKASKSEKNKLLDMPRVVKSGLPLRDGSGDYVENVGGDGSQSTRRTRTKNIHPTCKPVKLMSYLITLGSREGDIVLDNFGGSGTTGVATKLLGRKCIMYEIDEAYCEIAAKRCSQQAFI